MLDLGSCVPVGGCVSLREWWLLWCNQVKKNRRGGASSPVSSNAPGYNADFKGEGVKLKFDLQRRKSWFLSRTHWSLTQIPSGNLSMRLVAHITQRCRVLPHMKHVCFVKIKHTNRLKKQQKNTSTDSITFEISILHPVCSSQQDHSCGRLWSCRSTELPFLLWGVPS